MSGLGIGLTALVMLVGLVGTVVPMMPGLIVIWGAGLAYGLVAGFGTAGWTAFAVMTGLLVVGTVASFVLPYRGGAASGAPRATLAVGVAGGLVGFVVLPVLGLPVGAVAGVYLAELRRLGDGSSAWRSTRGVLIGFGLGALAEFGAGFAMVLAWAAWVILA